MKKINYKNLDWKKTIFCNFGQLGYPLFVTLYLILCLRAINNISIVLDPILKLPFIIIIGYSAIKLISEYNTKPKIFLKNVRGKKL